MVVSIGSSVQTKQFQRNMTMPLEPLDLGRDKRFTDRCQLGLLLDISIFKSSLPCPGEEAPPRPKSLVGGGTWWLQTIEFGPKGGFRFGPSPRNLKRQSPFPEGFVQWHEP